MTYLIIINNAIFINICQYLVNIGNPNPCLLRFRLAANVLFHAGTYIDEYCQFLQERSLFRKACRISFGEFGLWATRCTDLPPICIRMHPYAPTCLHTPYLHLLKRSKIESLNSCSPQAARIQSSILISTPAVAHAYKKKPKSNGPIKRPI